MNTENKLTGYPSIDKPWLKYYSEEAINADYPNCTAYDYLKQSNVDNLNSIAISYLGQRITYRELFEKIDRTADALISFGVSRNDIITIMLPASVEEVYLLYGIDKAGAAANYIIPNTPFEMICETIKMHNSKLLFIWGDYVDDEDLIYRKSGVEKIVVIAGKNKINTKNPHTYHWNDFINSESHKKTDYLRVPSDVLIIAKTGGTTGTPKSVMLNDNSFNIVVHQIKLSSINYCRGDKWLRAWPLFSATAAIASNHLPLCYGMELVIAPMTDINNIDGIIYEGNL